MKLTVKFKLAPTKEQEELLRATLDEYIATVNNIVRNMIHTNETKLTTKDIVANLPSALKNQAIRDAQSLYRRYKKTKIVPVLKKPMSVWNNRNFKIKGNLLSIPVAINGKSHRILIKAFLTDYQLNRLRNKLGALRITRIAGKWMAQVAVEVPEKPPSMGNNVMGVDLGLKVPAVAVTSNGKTKFFGNGRQNKFIRRKYFVLRQKLGRAKKLKKIKQLGNKEQRWMRDQDHKISRQIVNFALANGVSLIRLENLRSIKEKTLVSRKHKRNLHNWSFRRLTSFIEYKARLAGIRVEYMNPKYTS